MKYICASHGGMASGVKNTVEMFLGKQANIYAIDAYVEKRDFTQDFLELIRSFAAQERIIVFTDVFSGSVNQAVTRCLPDYDIQVITGFNLPLIMEIVLRQDSLDNEEIDAIVMQAKEQMIFVNSYIKKGMEQ